ncbi:MAG: hypothetical protein Kow0059_04850 [Candidatus Sumerlaeia bacterium]
MNPHPPPPRLTLRHWSALGAAAVAYLLATVPFLGPAYYDLGDGNYLYVAMRMAQGLKPYRDILAPQPPVHLFTGAALVQLGEALGGGDARLYTVRAFNLALRLATMLLVAALGLKIFRAARPAVAAAVVYAFLPIGFWWTQMFESEQEVIFFLLAGLWFMLNFTPRAFVAASLCHTAALFTNMTAVPYVGLAALFVLVRRPRLLGAYLAPLVVLAAAGVGLLEWWSGGWYLNNTFLNQVGSYPDPRIIGRPLWHYMLGKIVNEGGDVMQWEGGWVVLAFVGMIDYYRHGAAEKKQATPAAATPDLQPPAIVRELALIFSLGLVGSITFATKGGTADYIFTLGEPAVALFAAWMLTEYVRPRLAGLLSGARRIESPDPAAARSETTEAGGAAPEPDTAPRRPGPLPAILAGVGLALALCGFGLVFIVRNMSGGNYELPAAETTRLRAAIETYAPPGAPILAPPFFAFLTGRPLIGEYSEHFLWNIKFITETFEGRPAEAVALFDRIAAALERRELPIVLIDRNQTYQRPPVRRALDAHYERAPGFPADVQMLNTSLGVYIPRR